MPISRTVPTPSASSFEHKQVQVSTSPTLILQDNPDRLELVISNQSGLSIYVGEDATLSTSNGLIVPTGTILTLRHYNGRIYARTASGTATISLAQFPKPI